MKFSELVSESGQYLLDNSEMIHSSAVFIQQMEVCLFLFISCNLGSVITAIGGVEADVRHRVNEGCKVLGALKGVMKNRGLRMNVKKVLYEKVVVPTVMYGSVMGCESNGETETKFV